MKNKTPKDGSELPKRCYNVEAETTLEGSNYHPDSGLTTDDLVEKDWIVACGVAIPIELIAEKLPDIGYKVVKDDKRTQLDLNRKEAHELFPLLNKKKNDSPLVNQFFESFIRADNKEEIIDWFLSNAVKQNEGLIKELERFLKTGPLILNIDEAVTKGLVKTITLRKDDKKEK